MTIDLPSGRQTYDFDCGAKALQLVLAYYGVDVPEALLFEKLKINNRHGTLLVNMIAVAKEYGFQVIAKCGMTLKQIRDYIDNNIPAIVLLQAWSKRPLTVEEWRHHYEDGHYAVFVGHYGSIFVFEDPASFSKTWLTEKEFMARWHDIDPVRLTKLEHFSMVLLGKDPSPKHRMMEHMD